MCPDHRRRSKVLLGQEAVIFAVHVGVLAALWAVARAFDGAPAWLGGALVMALGVPVYLLLRRDRQRNTAQLEQQCRACAACAAA